MLNSLLCWGNRFIGEYNGLKSIITFITVRYSKTFHSPSAHEISQHISHLGPIDEQAIFVITYLYIVDFDANVVVIVYMSSFNIVKVLLKVPF